jgi:5'-nucleotidase
MQRSRVLVALVVMVVAAGGCSLFGSASRHAAAPSTVAEPFWCDPTAGTTQTALSSTDCQTLSLQLDTAVLFAEGHPHPPAVPVFSPYETGRGVEYRLTDTLSTFDAAHPDVLLYDGTTTTSQVVGIEYTVGNGVAGNPAPEGFVGPNDVWTDLGGGYWRLRVWILRPFQDQTNVFATTHPCLGGAGPIYDVTAPCYTSTHPNPLEVLVSNDDGVGADGIDAVVEALRVLPGVHVTVSAPATNQSGAGSKFTDGPVTETDATTKSGYPAWSVAGFPVDAVRYALRTRHLNPDLVVSGSNNGQNIGVAVPLSGTIGAAREGAQNAIPALAISQGLGSPPDFPASVTPLLAWYDDFVYGRAGRPYLEPVTNINVPTCTSGTIRGTVHVPVTPSFAAASNCASTVTPVTSDVEAFANGFVSVSNLSATSGAAS